MSLRRIKEHSSSLFNALYTISMLASMRRGREDKALRLGPSTRFACAEGVRLAEAEGRAAKRSQEPESTSPGPRLMPSDRAAWPMSATVVCAKRKFTYRFIQKANTLFVTSFTISLQIQQPASIPLPYSRS